MIRREEAGCVVRIEDYAAGVDERCAVNGINSNRFISPVVEIGRCGMGPVLVAGY